MKTLLLVCVILAVAVSSSSSSTGAADSSTGSADSSTGAADSSTGAADSSTGAADSSTGAGPETNATTLCYSTPSSWVKTANKIVTGARTFALTPAYYKSVETACGVLVGGFLSVVLILFGLYCCFGSKRTESSGLKLCGLCFSFLFFVGLVAVMVGIVAEDKKVGAGIETIQTVQKRLFGELTTLTNAVGDIDTQLTAANKTFTSLLAKTSECPQKGKGIISGILTQAANQTDVTLREARLAFSYVQPISADVNGDGVSSKVDKYNNYRVYCLWFLIVTMVALALFEVTTAFCREQPARKCSASSCLSSTVLFVLLCVALASISAYASVGLVSSDACASPEASVTTSIDSLFNGDARDLAHYYSSCTENNASDTLHGQLDTIAGYSGELDKIIKLADFNTTCPKLADELYTVFGECAEAVSTFKAGVYPLGFCDALYPMLCEALGAAGVCGNLTEGSLRVALTQAVALMGLVACVIASRTASNAREEDGGSAQLNQYSLIQ